MRAFDRTFGAEFLAGVPSAPGVVAASGRDAAGLLSAAQRGTQASPATFGVTTVVVGHCTGCSSAMNPTTTTVATNTPLSTAS